MGKSVRAEAICLLVIHILSPLERSRYCLKLRYQRDYNIRGVFSFNLLFLKMGELLQYAQEKMLKFFRYQIQYKT